MNIIISLQLSYPNRVTLYDQKMIWASPEILYNIGHLLLLKQKSIFALSLFLHVILAAKRASRSRKLVEIVSKIPVFTRSLSNSSVARYTSPLIHFIWSVKLPRQDVISFFISAYLPTRFHFARSITCKTTINRRSLGFLLCNLY